MPWVNYNTRQIAQGTQAQRPPLMPTSQPSSSGFNPLSGIRQGLNLGGKFLGGTGGNILGGLGSLGGLGLSIARGNPGGAVGSFGSLAGYAAPLAQGLGFGTVGSTFGGSLAAGGSALANTLSGGLVGTAGPIVGAGAGVAGSGLAGALGTIAGPLSLAGLIGGLAMMMPRGQPAKDIKAEGKIIASAQNDIRNALQNKAPIDLDRLRVTGSFTKNAQGRLVGTNGHSPKLLAAYLNAGYNIPKVKGAIGTAADVEGYVIPMEVTQGAFQAGGGLDPNPNDPLLSMQVFIPAKAIKVKIDEVTGQTTYRASNDPTPEQKRARRERDRRSEERSISRQD